MPAKKILQEELICAIATPPGRGALAIVRLSGKDAYNVAKKITKTSLTPRQACFTSFFASDNSVIDQGLAIYFQAPASFTGEDVVELHCHGNPLVAETLLKTICAHGARLANAGEFSLRAFLNNKIDLTQAEAIADLINSTTEQSVRTATKSLQGEFSQRVQTVLTKLIQIRVQIEAHLDFPDEEIDRQKLEQIQTQLNELDETITDLLQQAKLGERLQQGASIAIAGRPNAGKSSLLNVLAQSDIAIVTEIPGTTRDPLMADIEINGIAVRLIDTAGMRETKDIIENKGIERAQVELQQADIILWIIDASDEEQYELPTALDRNKVIKVFNKCDLITAREDVDHLYISATTQQGIDQLITKIGQRLGQHESGDTPFLARSRHVVALQQARQNIQLASQRLNDTSSLELAAEDLRIAQQHLNRITGEFSSDDLLGKIFSEFCIGK